MWLISSYEEDVRREELGYLRRRAVPWVHGWSALSPDALPVPVGPWSPILTMGWEEFPPFRDEYSHIRDTRIALSLHRHTPWCFAGIRLHPPGAERHRELRAGAGDGKPGDTRCLMRPLLQLQDWQPTPWAPWRTVLPSSWKVGYIEPNLQVCKDI